ncbi:DUF3231 family protein, partial [Bacillus sp. UNCCL13]
MNTQNGEPKLTSGEIAALWTQYLNDTAGLCFNKYMLEHLKDPEIKGIFEYAISLGQDHIQKIKKFLRAENFPIPIGFTDNDVMMNSE